MRPLRLEIKGFSAFADPTVVDFTDVELAAFVGPTGSGKSSVIDAMTFALYGAAARYDQRAVAPVINQRSTEARVRFDFELAGTAYTAVRVVRRTRTGATTKEARLEAGGEVLAGDEKALSATIVELLGLDFDKFNKTVVLPQGRFAEFLHDKPSERQELLRGLLGVGIYDRVGKAARLREAEARNAAELLERQLAGAGDVSDERLAELNARAEGAAALLDVVEAIAEELAAIDSEAAAVDRQLQTDLARHQAFAGVTVPDGVMALHDAVSTAAARRDAAASEHDAASARRDAAAAAAAAGPNEAAMLVLVGAHDACAAAQQAVVAAGERLALAETAHVAATGAADDARRHRAAAVTTLDAARQRWQDLERQWRAAGDLGRVRHVLGLVDRRVTMVEVLAAADDAVAEAQTALAAAAVQHDAAGEARAAAERLEPAAVLAAHLLVGQPCPVCAQMVSAVPEPHGDGSAHVAAARAAERRAAERLAEARDARQRAEVDVVGQRAALAEVDEQVGSESDRAALAALEHRLVELGAMVDEARAATDAAAARLAAIDADPQVAAVLATERRCVGELAAARAVVTETEDAAARAAAVVIGQPARRAAAAALAEARTLAAARDDAAVAERAVADRLARAAAALDAARRREHEARQAYETVRERLAGSMPTGRTRDAAPATGDRQGETKPAGRAPSPAVALPPMPARTAALADDWVTLAAWATGAAEALAAVVADARAAAATLAARRRDRLAELAGALTGGQGGRPAPTVDVVAERRRLNDELVAARTAVATLELERARVADAQREVAAWRTRAAVAGLLGNLLRTDAFERWLLEEALADLVGRANVRLAELTSGQYALTVVDGSFRVIDHHNADEVRDARSLSGGETFLTSLALALALADSTVDSAAQGSEPIESIFLDEGFGTLDPDTLDVVAGTIEELGASGRMVGIITHIRELAERMPTRFEVTKTAHTSTIDRVDV